MTDHSHPQFMTFVLATMSVLLCTASSFSAERNVPVPRARPTTKLAATDSIPSVSRVNLSLPTATTGATSSADLGTVKQAVELARRGKAGEATALEASLRDPLAHKLVEWAILRSDDSNADFDRYAAFIAANPSWPSVGMFQRRAEIALWDERRSPAAVRAFFATCKPLTPKGRFALARALLVQGDRNSAAAYVRDAWRNDAFSSELEAQALETFRDLITNADHEARMDQRFYAEDIEGGMRAAHRLGRAALAIAKARAAVIAKAANAGALLDAVPDDARGNAGYLFSRIQYLRRGDHIIEAARLMLAAPREPSRLHNLDEWWVERRLIARKLLDIGDAQAAYRVARDAAPPPRENYRAEHEFTAGWIALRFLNDPALANTHFARVALGTSNPITIARSEYWQGRAFEASGRHAEAHAHYEAAARFPTAYYGQIARAKLGLGEITLRRPLEPSPDQRTALMGLEVVRAVAILYAIGERDLVVPFVADLAERATDIGALVATAEIAARQDDARAMLLIGKTALGRGFSFDHYAFPTVGIPNYGSVGPAVDRCVIYSIVRQESAFNPRDISTANAIGLLQVTPEAGRYVAKKFGVAFDLKRLHSDIVYNTQLGAGELGDLLQDYRGSYILTFAGYNAGRSRVHEWIERYGDPRNPNVDPVDWIERIPFSETRNYVERVLENLQVYRVRLGLGTRLMIDADLRRGAI